MSKLLKSIFALVAICLAYHTFLVLMVNIRAKRDYTIVPVLVSSNTSHVAKEVSFDETFGRLTIKMTVFYGFISDKCIITQYANKGQENIVVVTRSEGRRLIGKYWSKVIPRSVIRKMDRWFEVKRPYHDPELKEIIAEWHEKVHEWKEGLENEADSNK